MCVSFLRASLSRPPKMTRNFPMEQRAWAARGVGTPRFNCIGLDHVLVAVNVEINTHLIFSKICSRLRIQNLIYVPLVSVQCYTDIVLCMHSANERYRYTVTPSLIGWVHTQNDPCYVHLLTNTNNKMGHGQHLNPKWIWMDGWNCNFMHEKNCQHIWSQDKMVAILQRRFQIDSLFENCYNSTAPYYQEYLDRRCGGR